MMMTTPMVCLVIGCFLPLIWVAFTGPGRAALSEGLDNCNPRGQKARLEGMGARAIGAESNAFEALPLFMSAVFIHHVTQGDPGLGSKLAIGWVACRVAHGTFYLANVHPLRSLSWMSGVGCALGMIFAT